jgi:NAD dependent epimerase/dehydratase family enzyme
VILSSQRVRPRVALDRGYPFRVDDLDAALEDLLRRANP